MSSDNANLTLQDKIGSKLPWVFGKRVRIPRIKFPVYREGQMSLPSPGRSLVLILTYIFLFYLVAGGIYIGIRDPIAVGGTSDGRAVWIYPGTQEAFIIESIAAAFIIFLSGVGFYFVFQSTKHAYNYQYAIKIFVLGIVMAFGGFIMLQYIIGVKMGLR